MTARQRRLLWALIVVGVLARVAVAFATRGNPYDIDSLTIVERALHSPASVYGQTTDRWPYPPGFFPLVWLAGRFAEISGLPFHGWVQLPQILADGAIAWLVQMYLGIRGADGTTRIRAGGLIALGPSFAVISGYQGQIDSFAILPAVVAVVLWTMPRVHRHRALYCGILIGVAATIKSVPILTLVALLPTVTSRREAAVLVGSAVAVPMVSLMPFLIVDYGPTRSALSYHGIAGLGGISLLVQPDLARSWIGSMPFAYSDLSRTLSDAGTAAVAGSVLLSAFLATRARATPSVAAVIVFLAVYVLGINFFFQYLIWGLPFLIMAGRIRAAFIVQALALPPMLVSVLAPWSADIVSTAYFWWMTTLWACALLCLLACVAAAARQSPSLQAVRA